MAKRIEERDTKTCKFCDTENELRARICTGCGAFISDRLEVDAAISALNKKYRKEEGDNLICRMGEHPFYASSHPAVSSGSLKLDKALLGGFPMTSRIHLYGDENSGKTTLALHIVAAVQKRGGTVCYIDVEHALDGHYAERIGVNIKDLIIAKPESGTEALDQLLAIAPVVDLIVLDSIAACASIDSINKETLVDADGEIKQRYDVGDLARLMSSFQSKLMNIVAKTTCTFVFINQLRTQVNPKNPAYSPQKPMGGRAPKYFTSIWLKARTDEELFEDDVYVGRRTLVKIERAKHIGVYESALITITNNGIDVTQEVIDLSVEYEIIKRSGSWFELEGKNGWKVQGVKQVREKLQEDPELFRVLEQAVRAKIEEAHNAAKSYGAKLDDLVGISDGTE